MKRTKRTYSKEFKEKTVSLSYKRANLRELADELGISVDRIYDWRKASSQKIEDKTYPAYPTDDQSEIKRLRKELKNTQIELEILKKAVHIFSKSDGNTTNL